MFKTIVSFREFASLQISLERARRNEELFDLLCFDDSSIPKSCEIFLNLLERHVSEKEKVEFSL